MRTRAQHRLVAVLKPPIPTSVYVSCGVTGPLRIFSALGPRSLRFTVKEKFIDLSPGVALYRRSRPPSTPPVPPHLPPLPLPPGPGRCPSPYSCIATPRSPFLLRHLPLLFSLLLTTPPATRQAALALPLRPMGGRDAGSSVALRRTPPWPPAATSSKGALRDGSREPPQARLRRGPDARAKEALVPTARAARGVLVRPET